MSARRVIVLSVGSIVLIGAVISLMAYHPHDNPRAAGAVAAVAAKAADASLDAQVERLTGYQAVIAGSDAEKYIATNWSCQGALRVQYLAGYIQPSPAPSQVPLWQSLCSGVNPQQRDQMAQEAAWWGASHQK